MRLVSARMGTPAAFLALLLLTGCGGSGDGGDTAASSGAYDPHQDPFVNPERMFEEPPADESQIALDETLFRNLDGNPGSLNPLFQSSTFEFEVLEMLFTGLFTFGSDMKFRVNDEVVASFEESPDHLVYTVRLKPGLTWHDGHAFTAHDVAFSWETILDDRVPCPAVRSGTDQIVKCEAVDDLTVRMVHQEALATNPWNALFPIIPQHIYEKDRAANPDLKSGEHNNRYNRAPVGNGPYRFVRWLENDKIELERWDDYFGKPAKFQGMVFRIIPDTNILMLTFNKGDVDEFRMEPKQFATQTGADSDFAKMGYKLLAPQWLFLYIGWNMDGSNPFFADVRVRRAMAMACDIERICRDLAYNLYTPAYGIYHPDSWMFNPEVVRLPFDLEQAADLLDQAGWRVDESQEGWRYKVVDGVPVKLQFTLNIPEGAAISRDIAAIFQEDLRSIGVHMDTQIIEWATFSERNRKHEFQASIAAWGTGTDPDTGRGIWMSDQYKADGSEGRNYGGYKNPRVDELFDLGRKEFDFEKRREIYQEIHKLTYEDQPYIFVYNRGTFWGIQQRIRGVNTGPRGVFSFDPSVLAWWVKKGEAKYPTLAKT